MYWREYRTEFHIGLTYGVSEPTVCRTIQKIENVLLQSKQFHLPGKKELAGNTSLEIVLVDATEQPIERPKKQKLHYSGEKKRHTQKAQLRVDWGSARILATDFCHGSQHDFRLFKRNHYSLAEQTGLLADAG